MPNGAGGRVVIVGGGIAGLTAAWRLSQNPDLDIRVIEAEKNFRRQAPNNRVRRPASRYRS